MKMFHDFRPGPYKSYSYQIDKLHMTSFLIITKTRPFNIQQFFTAVKMKNSDIFLTFAQNIDCGYA